MNSTDFQTQRRQPYLSMESFQNTLQHHDETEKLYLEDLKLPNIPARDRQTMFGVIAEARWINFQLRHTAGESPAELASLFTAVVEGFENYTQASLEVPDEDYSPVFPMTEMIDIYIDYLHLLCVAILLRREDLIPRIHEMNVGTDYDEADAVIEDLLGFYLPGRPDLDDWFWDRPYGQLLDAIDSATPRERTVEMKKYVKKWYSSMKGQASFWGSHEQMKPDFTPYFGYWAMCSAAFSYLYEIDDTEFRDELVYPKDLVDHARSTPRAARIPASAAGSTRVQGGQPCPISGYWFTPAKMGSRAHFQAGAIMPNFDNTTYGATIWQWSEEQ